MSIESLHDILRKQPSRDVLNNTHREKLCFAQFSIRMAASDLFHMFTQSIKFYTFHYHILKDSILNFETDFLEKENLFQKPGVPLFS